MRKMYKLLSVVLCVAIMSTFITVVSANTPQEAADRSDNLILYGRFEEGQTWGFSVSDKTNIKPDAGAARRGSYGLAFNLSTTNTSAFSFTTGGNASMLPLEVGGYYYYSVWAKAGVATDSTFQLRPAGGLSYKWKPTAYNGTEWTHYQNVGIASATNATFSFVMTENGKGVYPFSLDDFSIIPIKLVGEVENVPVEGKLTVSGPEELELSTSNVVITDGTNEVAPTTVSINRANGDSVWDIAYEGLTGSTDYSLIIKTDITNEADYPTFAFTTEEQIVVTKPVSKDIFALNGFDGSFETVNAGSYQGELANNLTAGVKEDASGAYMGSKYLTISDCGWNSGVGLLYPRLIKGVSAGKKYVVSFYAKTEDAGTNYAQIWAAYQSGNNIFTTPVYDKENKPVVAEWKRITAVVEPVRNASAAADAVNLGIHIGLKGASGPNSFDNLQMHELTPLSLDNSVLASVSKNATGVDIDMLSTDGEKTVYCMAAKYTGNKATGIKFAKATLSSTLSSISLEGVTDDYTLFIWDNNLKPLCNSFTLAD